MTNRPPRPPVLRLALCLALCFAAVTLARAQTDEPAGLPAALRSALLRHPALAGKQAQVRAKAAAADSARAQRYPTLSASAGTGQSAGYSGASTVTLRAQQPLWAFGRIDSAIAYADQDIQAQQADAWSTRRQVLEETAVAYATVQSVRERLGVAQQSVARHVELQQQIRRRADGGLASAVDVSMAQTRLLQALAQRESAASDLRSAQASLLALTQELVDSELPVPPGSTELPGEQAVREQVLAQSAALRYREAQLALALADVQRERNAAMPTVMLEAARNQVSGLPNQNSSNTLTLVVQGSLDGMGLISRGRQQAALERVEAARQDLAQQQHEQDIQLRQLLDRRASDQTLLAGYAESVAALDGTLASFRRQYESGYKSWLDVLNAVRELADQQLQQVQVQASWRVNSLRLAARMGRLDEPTGSPPAPQDSR